MLIAKTVCTERERILVGQFARNEPRFHPVLACGDAAVWWLGNKGSGSRDGIYNYMHSLLTKFGKRLAVPC